MEKTIHISFKEKNKDISQDICNLEEDMKNLSLKNNYQNQHSLQIATRENNNDYDSPYQEKI